MNDSLSRLYRRVAGLIGRGIVQSTDDSDSTTQTAQVDLVHGTRDDVPIAQPYGLASRPHDGAEAVVIHATPDQPIVIMCNDTRYRMSGLEQGEVAIYDDQGQHVLLSRDGIKIVSSRVQVSDSDDLLIAGTGVLTGESIDPFTGQPHSLLGNGSPILKAKGG